MYTNYVCIFIEKMKKKLLGMGLVTALMLSVVGCSDKDTTETVSTEEVTTETVSTEEVTTEELVASDTDTTATTEMEEVSTWFDNNNITFTDGEVSIPVYASDSNEETVITSMDATYSEPVISVSEEDVDGNVTYTVTYDVSGQWIGTLPVSVAQNGISTRIQFETYYFIDAYSGTVFPNAEMDDDNNSYSVDSVVEVDGKEYTIKTSSSFETDWSDINWTDLGNEVKAKRSYEIHITIDAVVPAEYDGLILGLDGNGATEYDDIDTEIQEAYPFEGNVNEYIFKDVTFGNQ